MKDPAQIIEKNGRPEWAVLPYEEYRRLAELASETVDRQAYDHALQSLDAGEETLPANLVKALLDGTGHPLKTWREYRGKSQQQLAEEAGISKSYLSQIESGKRAGGVRVLHQLAKLLDVEIDDLVSTR